MFSQLEQKRARLKGMEFIAHLRQSQAEAGSLDLLVSTDEGNTGDCLSTLSAADATA